MQDNQAIDQKVEMWTDGACKGNPGPGGWGVLLRAGGHEKTLHGGELQTTNNRMELMAVIEGLRALKRTCVVTIHTDSRAFHGVRRHAASAAAARAVAEAYARRMPQRQVFTHATAAPRWGIPRPAQVERRPALRG